MLILTLSTAFAADLRLEATLHGTGGFGSAVAAGDLDADGNTDLLVGQPLDEGFVVHHGGLSGLGEAPAVTWRGGSPGYASGLTIADVDGNGFPDAVIGAPEAGALDLFFGGPYGLGGLAATYGGYDRIGYTVSHADTNGDGLADIVANARSDSQGRIVHFAGDPSGLGAGRRLVVPYSDVTPVLPTTGIGDLDGDGYDEIAAGSPMRDEPLGWVSIFFGSADGPRVSADYQVGVADTPGFGMQVGAAGDVDADGYADIVVLSGGREGATAWVIPGSTYGPDVAVPFQTSPTSDPSHAAYSSVSGVGDLDGDGFDDVAIAWSYASESDGSEGARLMVFRGAAAGLRSQPWFDSGEIPARVTRPAVGPAGDVDGDGVPEMYLGLGTLDEVRVYGSDGAPDPGDTDPPDDTDAPDPDDTDRTDTDDGGIATGGHGCTCGTGRPSGAAGALLLGLVLLSAPRLRSRP